MRNNGAEFSKCTSEQKCNYMFEIRCRSSMDVPNAVCFVLCAVHPQGVLRLIKHRMEKGSDGRANEQVILSTVF